MKCKFCQTEGLEWKQADGRWRMVYPDGSKHLCKLTRRIIATSIHSGFTKGAPPSKPLDVPPTEDLDDPWWDFLNAGEKVKEIIP